MNDDGVTETLPSSDGLITCVRFLNDNTLVSTDDKGTLKVWIKRTSEAGKAHFLILAGSNVSFSGRIVLLSKRIPTRYQLYACKEIGLSQDLQILQ